MVFRRWMSSGRPELIGANQTSSCIDSSSALPGLGWLRVSHLARRKRTRFLSGGCVLGIARTVRHRCAGNHRFGMEQPFHDKHPDNYYHIDSYYLAWISYRPNAEIHLSRL